MLALCVALVAPAKDDMPPTTYNYTRGVEAYNNENYDEALEYMEKELADNPGNGYAYAYIYTAILREYYNQPGVALSAINNAIKKLPKKDKEYRAIAHASRSRIYLSLEDTTSALNDLAVAISLQPECTNYLMDRAQIYFEQNKYDLANADYNRMIAIDEGDVVGYVGLGRNLFMQKEYEEAIKLFDYVIKLAPDYSPGYSQRAACYMKLKQYDKTLDDIIKSIDIGGENNAVTLLQNIADSAYTNTVAKLKVQRIKDPNDNSWDYCLGVVHEHTGHHVKAIESYKAVLDKDASGFIANRISACYDMLGECDEALEYIDRAIQLDSTDYTHMLTKAGVFANAGRLQEAINTYSIVLDANPEYELGYYHRGETKERMGDLEGALEDYTMLITLNPEDSYPYTVRGRLYKAMKKDDLARADFLKTIELDEAKEPEERMSFYAHFLLGENEKAIEVLNASYPQKNKDYYYNAACLYSLMGDTIKALDHFEESLKLGTRAFAHIEQDTDFNNIRNCERFKDLVAKYKALHREGLVVAPSDSTQYEEQVVEIPFTKEAGVCRVKCIVNGLPLHFVFDTGAADVSISNVEAQFMLKNDYLQSSDFGGTQRYVTASGDISEGTIINLRKIEFGGLTLDNVKASVARNQSAPLLLGQSVRSRLGKIEIDNANRVLKITHRTKVSK